MTSSSSKWYPLLYGCSSRGVVGLAYRRYKEFFLVLDSGAPDQEVTKLDLWKGRRRALSLWLLHGNFFLSLQSSPLTDLHFTRDPSLFAQFPWNPAFDRQHLLLQRPVILLIAMGDDQISLSEPFSYVLASRNADWQGSKLLPFLHDPSGLQNFSSWNLCKPSALLPQLNWL